MQFPANSPTKKTSGFIISLEFLLVLALVVFPIMIGLFLLADRWITLYKNQQALVERPLSRPVIWDSRANARVVGAVIGYDRFEAPQVLYRDGESGRTIDGVEFNPGVLLGVWPNRFTTLSKVYYEDSDCTGTAYLASSAASVKPWQEVGAISQLQGINYGVGNNNFLYRSALDASGNEIAATGGTGGQLTSPATASVWTSQATGDEKPASGDPTTTTACVNLSDTGAVELFFAADGGTTLVTAVSQTSHNLRTGDTINISVGTGNVAGYDGGPFTITVTSPNTFTYMHTAVTTAITLPGNNVRLMTNTALGTDEPFTFGSTVDGGVPFALSETKTDGNFNWDKIEDGFDALVNCGICPGLALVFPSGPVDTLRLFDYSVPLGLVRLGAVTATFAQLRNLVQTTSVQLASPTGAGTTFDLPFRLAFPSAIPSTVPLTSNRGG